MLRCEECLCISADARGWISKLIDANDDEPLFEPYVVFYCPHCAARQFGFVSKRGMTRPN